MPAAHTLESDSALTPVMRQYRAAKEAHPDALLFFRLGDFYELFYEDAIVASRELQLTLTSRDKTKSVPMCGVPYHAAGNYLQRLLRKGYRVALCEQMEDPKATKTIVRREVTRVLTPGTALDAALDPSQGQWLAAVAARSPTGAQGGVASVGLAAVDLSTGELRATEFRGAAAWAQALDELARIQPAELLLQRGSGMGGSTQSARQGSLPTAAEPARQSATTAELPWVRTEVEEWAFEEDYALPLLQQQLRVQSLEGLGLSGQTAAAVACGVLVHYLRATRQGALEHIDGLRVYTRQDCLQLDAVSVRNLELVEPLFVAEGPQTTLFHTLDYCATPMGRRLLRAQLLRPLNDLDAINARLDAVQLAVTDLRRREPLRSALENILDLERLLGRIALDSAGPRDLMALAHTMARLPGVRAAVAVFADEASRWAELAAQLDPLDDLYAALTRTLADEPPVSLAEPGTIRAGVNAELDELRSLSSTGRQRLAAIEERERQRTGIGSLKVRFNSVFGYYLEVTKANAAAVPAEYERRQTLVNAERFTTPELKELEHKILTAQERSGEIERQLFQELRRELLGHAARMRQTARLLAEIDLLAALAHLAALRGWVRPQVDRSGVLELVAARHPVIERRLEEMGGGRFTPNSLSVCAAGGDFVEGSGAPSLLLLTGPNMGGKSTYLRTAALLTLMAQCGCFVPAERMRVGLVDRIFTRIGAADNLAHGRSTFMVEMTETAAILNTATTRSLVLLDEMGRGTATYDGLSLAWATVEHLHNELGCRTLFATHYHELTLLAERLPRLRNLRVTVRETATGIVFLHTVEAGAASKSYGIEVARLAGLPQVVIERARQVLAVHERAESQQVRQAIPAAGPEAQVQLTMFTPLSQQIVDRLAAVDLDGLTPLQALSLLAELQGELKGGGG